MADAGPEMQQPVAVLNVYGVAASTSAPDIDRQHATLLKALEIQSTKLLDVKREEEGWVRIFLLYFSGAAALCVLALRSKWLVLDRAELWLFAGMAFVTLLVVVLASATFVRLRRGYYKTTELSNAVAAKLGLHDPSQWPDGTAPFASDDRGNGKGAKKRTWSSVTNPWATFLARVVTISGAGVICCALCGCVVFWKAPDGASDWFFSTTVIFVALCFVQAIVAFIVDFKLLSRDLRLGRFAPADDSGGTSISTSNQGASEAGA